MKREKAKPSRGAKTTPEEAPQATGAPETRRAPSLPSRADALATATLGLLIAVSYFPATRLGFVWDDVIITTLPAIQDWQGLWDLWFAPASAYRKGFIGEDHYWPVLYTTFWLEHKLWGFAPAGYHIVNLVLHLINTVLLWRLFLRLAVPGAWWVAAIFAVHPLHVESVAWVIARKDLLATLFYLAAFAVWLRFVGAPRIGRYVAVMVLFAAGMLSKSIVVTFPAALLIWHWWKAGRVTGPDLIRLVPLFLLAAALAALDLAIYQKVNLSFDYTLTERALMAAHSLWFYAGKLLFPVHLAVLYPPWDLAGAPAWGYLAAAAAALASLWLLRRRVGRGPLACALFFGLTLSPVLGFVDFGYMNVSFAADRYQYLAGAGVLMLVAGGAARGAERLRGAAKTAATAAAGVVLALLATGVWLQCGVYQNDLTLFRHAAATHPDSWAAHSRAGAETLKRKRYDEAERHFRRSLELRSHDATGRHRRDTLQNIAETLRMRGRHAEALATYRAASAEDPGYALAHLGMGAALFNLRRYDEAVAALERARILGLQPARDAAIRRLLAQALDRAAHSRFTGQRYQEALELYRKRIALEPGHAEPHANAGAALFYLGRLDEALRSFERALTLKPDLESARSGREAALRRLRQGGGSGQVRERPGGSARP